MYCNIVGKSQFYVYHMPCFVGIENPVEQSWILTPCRSFPSKKLVNKLMWRCCCQHEIGNFPSVVAHCNWTPIAKPPRWVILVGKMPGYPAFGTFLEMLKCVNVLGLGFINLLCQQDLPMKCWNIQKMRFFSENWHCFVLNLRFHWVRMSFSQVHIPQFPQQEKMCWKMTTVSGLLSS